MRRPFILLALLLPGFLGGCVQSLHPYYTEAQLTYDPKLVGNWTDAEQKSRMVITGEAEAKAYQADYTDEESKTGKFELHLAKVNDHSLLDITPAEPQRENESDMYQVHLLPVHSFMLLERVDDDTLRVRQMEYDWLKRYLGKNPNAIAHETVGGDRILLTAATEKVQAFVLEHVKTPDAYTEPTELKRVRDATTAPVTP